MPVTTALWRWTLLLSPSPEESPHEVEDLGRIAVDVARVDGLVVFVDEDDHLFAVVGVEVAGEIEQRPVEERALGAPSRICW
jgi:hypothetical protein